MTNTTIRGTRYASGTPCVRQYHGATEAGRLIGPGMESLEYDWGRSSPGAERLALAMAFWVLENKAEALRFAPVLMANVVATLPTEWALTWSDILRGMSPRPV